ncbi:hypothetical protein LQG66_04585 [Bradyrhizobium ontarionense]|uniref:Uncharacterized protein n=1 Tax=Bradyrhizobium ontarionense TaxID=2898149 RepID=A0ABY3REX1_9BRAD|nr:hypothetical protein [Bradyrhizobium sp. A19]UFZ05597.1 hypothetical protein LQG66_04585 [Bradyrhizobium sp. A19]
MMPERGPLSSVPAAPEASGRRSPEAQGDRAEGPVPRAARYPLYMAIGTAAFELMLRQKDIIGDRLSRRAAPMAAIPLGFRCCISTKGPGAASSPGTPPRLALAHAHLKVEISRRGRVRPAGLRPILFRLMQMVPVERCIGVIIKDEYGLPIRYRSYADWWRQVATAAGIPGDVQSMDARVGGITET